MISDNLKTSLIITAFLLVAITLLYLIKTYIFPYLIIFIDFCLKISPRITLISLAIIIIFVVIFLLLSLVSMDI